MRIRSLTRLLNLSKPSRNGRSANKFEVIRPLKEIDRDTLAFRGPALWNALPDAVPFQNRVQSFE